MADAVNEKIIAQGNKIRELKSSKADKAAIKAEVDVLLALKAEYKSIAGKDWKPETSAAPPAAAKAAQPPKKEQTPPKTVEVLYTGGGLSDAEKESLKNSAANAIDIRICNAGDLIRKLKADKADKAKVEGEVKVLLYLKGLYKEKAGEDWQPPEKRGGADNKKENKPPQQKPAEK